MENTGKIDKVSIFKDIYKDRYTKKQKHNYSKNHRDLKTNDGVFTITLIVTIQNLYLVIVFVIYNN